MIHRDIIVIGASAGGVEAIKDLVQNLPPDLPAAIFVVLHLSPDARSLLPEIINRRSTLQAVQAKNGQAFLPGRIYVAPPDYHMELSDGAVGTIELNRGPRVNSTRPAIDLLFQSAARSYGRRVIGVLLTGYLADGSIGMAVIKSRGGIAVVQDPNEALASSMPLSAIARAKVDYILPIKEIPEKLLKLTTQPLEDEQGKERDYVE